MMLQAPIMWRSMKAILKKKFQVPNIVINAFQKSDLPTIYNRSSVIADYIDGFIACLPNVSKIQVFFLISNTFISNARLKLAKN